MSDATTADAAGYETRSVQLIDHALQSMINEHARQGWELVDVGEDWVASFRRPVDGGEPREYATVMIVPAARDAILSQWQQMGFELALERGRVAYMLRTQDAS